MGYDVGADLPLNSQLPLTFTDKFVQAVLRNPDGTEVTGSPVDLDHIANGYYAGTFPMPSGVDSVVAQYLAYDDADHTTLSGGLIPGTNVFELNAGGGGTTVLVSQITGVVESSECLETAEIVLGEDKTLYIRLVKTDGTPYDLSGATIVVNMRKADGTILSKTGTIVGSALLGRLSVAYTAANTALLAPGLLLTVEVKLTVSGVLTIVEIPNSIDVVDAL